MTIFEIISFMLFGVAIVAITATVTIRFMSETFKQMLNVFGELLEHAGTGLGELHEFKKMYDKEVIDDYISKSKRNYKDS